ncbi:Target of rapamycin complex 2 subunit bit61 [Termitomyces sp. J132]|nr:Target of rapamycin complex 2 subunit bit61 [Termitomyces sp. J132]
MHRLGSLTPQTATAASASSLALPAPPQPSLAATASADPWGALHVHVLPLFNGEPLRIPIEDLNVLVKRHIQSVVSAAPSKAVAALEADASDLIASGMVTLNAKLSGIDDDKLIARVVEIWGFFWDQVLTYVEGVLLPIQTDPLLMSLYRAPKTAASRIDVRCVALRAFRDKVILPLSPRMHQRLSMPNPQHNYHQETASYQQPRLQQMLLVLSSQRRPRALAFALAPTPTPGEQAIVDLLRVSRTPRPQQLAPMSPVARAPSFLSGGLPRDRRGRIAQKQNGRPRPPNLVGFDDDVLCDETPRGGLVERERDRELLESLRSPDVDATVAAARASVGGWGLGEGHEDVGRTADEEDDDMLEQAIVDYMVGMTTPPENRRRMT